MTPQQVYDKVVKHLFKQGKPAMSKDNITCMYLSLDGLKCAVGCLIKKEYYSEGFERKGIRHSPVIEAVHKSLNTEKYDKDDIFDLLEDLQYAHDYARVSEETEKFIPSLLKERLTKIAEDHALSLKVLETV